MAQEGDVHERTGEPLLQPCRGKREPAALACTGDHDAGISAPDHAAEAWFTWDENGINLSARVTDDQHTQPNTGNATWRADGIQFAVAPQWPGETDLRPEVQPRIEFGLALTPSGTQLYRFASGSVGGFLVDPASAAAVRDEAADTTVYEASIPWSLLAPIGATPDRALSLSLAINDADGGATRSWLEWGEGVTTSKDTELFEPVILASDATGNVTGTANARAQCWGDGPRLAAHLWYSGGETAAVRFSTAYGDAVGATSLFADVRALSS
jgi:hypothetical protein